jgi:uncharacterized protein YjbJ (UPF0337 family)
MFDSEELKGKWTEVKGEILKKWGELTENDLDKTKGNLAALVGLFQQKLGVKKEEAHQRLTEFAQRWLKKGENTKENVSDKVNAKIDNAKDDLKKH